MNELRERFIEQERMQEIINLLESGDIDTIRNEYGYRVFPTSPSLGLEQGYQVLTQLLNNQSKALGPRSVMPDIAHQCNATCMHLIKRAIYYLLGPEHPELAPGGAYHFIVEEGVNAWHIGPKALETGQFERHFDTRHMFDRAFLGNQSRIIQQGFTEDYLNSQIELGEYLREQGVPGTFIPALFSGTRSAGQIASQNGGWETREPNSHSFLFTGNTTSTFIASEIELPWEEIGTEGISLEDFLIYYIKDQGDIFTMRTIPDRVLRENIRHFGDIIDIEINGVPLSISQGIGDDTIRIYQDSTISISGSVVIDGLQVGESDMCSALGRRQMEMRVRFLYPFLVGKNYQEAHLSGRGFYFTSLIEPRVRVESMHAIGVRGEILQNILPQSFIYAGIGDDVQARYLSEISLQVFGKHISELTDEERGVIDDIYSIHSRAHQMFGYQAAGGASWNDGATNINAAIPFYGVDEESLTIIERWFNRYLWQREREYIELLRLQDDRPFVEVVVFGRGVPTQLLTQLEIQLDREYAEYLRDFTSVQRNQFAEYFLSPSTLGKSRLIPGDSIIIATRDIKNYIDLIRQLPSNNLVLYEANGNRSLDMELIESVTTNDMVRGMLAFILANESYVNPCESCNQFYREFIWGLQTHFASRRGAKDLVYNLEQSGWSNIYDEITAYIRENTGIIEELEGIGITIPHSFPRINSMGDFQVRYPVLRGVGGANLQPGGVVYQYLSFVLGESSGDNRLLELKIYIDNIAQTYPERVNEDIEIVRQLFNELNTDPQNHRSIEGLLMQLLRLNDGSNSNIVGKILELLVMEERVSSSLLNNIIEQFIRAGGDISEVELLDFDNAVILANHKGERVQKIIFAENHILRFLDIIRQRYGDVGIGYPVIQNNRLGQTIYNEWTFRRHLERYLEILQVYISHPDITIEDITILQSLESTLERISNTQGNTEFSEEIYRLHRDSELKEFLRNHNISTSYFPTTTELSGSDELRRAFFRYNGNQERVTDRIQKPELVDKNKVIILTGALLPIILLLNRWAKMLGSGLVRGQWKDDYRRLKKKKEKYNKALKNAEEREKLGIKVKNIKELQKQYNSTLKAFNRIAALEEFTPKTAKILKVPFIFASKIVKGIPYTIENIQNKFSMTPKNSRFFLNNIEKVRDSDIDTYIHQIKVRRRNDSIGIPDDKIIFGNTRGDGTDNYSDGEYKIGVNEKGEAFIRLRNTKLLVLEQSQRVKKIISPDQQIAAE
ncbi:hypothetical protein LAT59_00490 [Candidatus Gracilibacteria bacterium]|nr:hypothetical protein [Candidatus Gracilibacteria bacterium]